VTKKLALTILFLVAVLPEAPCEEVRATFSADSNDVGHVFRMAYLTAYETATGAPLKGADEYEKVDSAKQAVLSGGSGYPEKVETKKLADGKYEVSANFVPRGNIRKSTSGTREIVRLYGKPRMVVHMSEINFGKDVLRSNVEAKLEDVLLQRDFRLLNFPQDYLKTLEERKKSIEIRRTGDTHIITSGAIGTTQVEAQGAEYILDYSNLILGRGNEEEAVTRAKEVHADVIVVGGAYTMAVPLPPAAKAWIDQGYKKARAVLNVQAMVVDTRELVFSRTVEADAMDFSQPAAGNKALANAATQAGEGLIFELLDNLKARNVVFD
jgi:hypothetical protein